MSEENYKPNSHKYKAEQAAKAQEEKKVEKVVSGTVKTKKKSEGSKIKDIFISEDAANVKSYVLLDILVPAVKKAISDIVTNGIDILLYGERGKPGGKRSTSDRFSYGSIYDNRKDDRRFTDNRTRSGYSYDDIVVETRGEAEKVIDTLADMIDTYGVATVADLYDLVGITGQYTDNKYGWTNVRNAEPIRVRDGYLLKLPKALPIH